MAIDFKKIKEQMTRDANKMTSASDVRRKRKLIRKIEAKAGTIQLVIATKGLSFPFNPYDLNDPEVSKDNPFRIAAGSSEFVKGFCRGEYHSNPEFKERIDSKYDRIKESVKIELELPATLEIPEDVDAPLTKTEIAVYNQYGFLPTQNNLFRTLKGEKYSQLFKDPTPYSKTEEGLFIPQQESVVYMAARLEEALYYKNKKAAEEKVAKDPVLSQKPDKEKKEYVSEHSYSKMLLSFLQEKAILPVFCVKIDPATGASLLDKEFKKDDYAEFIGTMAYIQDKDFVGTIAQELGQAADIYLDYVVFNLAVNGPTGADVTKLTDTEKLEAYKQKAIKLSPKVGLQHVYPQAIDFIQKYVSLEYYEQQKAENPDLPDEKIYSRYSKYFEANAQCMLPIRDEDIVNRVTQARNVRDFKDRFTAEELTKMSPIFEKLNMDIVELLESAKVVDIIDAEFSDLMSNQGTKLLDVVAGEDVQDLNAKDALEDEMEL